MKKVFLILIISVSLNSCWWPEKYNIGVFPTTPTNLTDFNSVYDDYNSTAPTLGETFPLCFSSNRNSKGGNFDFIYKLMSIQFSRNSGLLSVFNETNGNLDVTVRNHNINSAMIAASTRADELGPYLIPAGGGLEEAADGDYWYDIFFLLYANNENGDLDIKFIHNSNDINYSAPAEVSFLNSAFDDAYPTLNADNSKIYFTSNRQGSFDIFYTVINPVDDLQVVLADTTVHTILKDEQLSSAFDDKCPFIAGDLLVFASNREGGYGGYDLYYSRLENGTWSAPVNFGATINSAYDEFRPIVRPQEDFTNDFMLFSSNRPGGLGGFDLYYVGIEKQ
jgi:WD40-like Beta Propeller Repeat